MTIVDASLAVKWITGERGREKANELFASGEQLAGPFLLRVEVMAAIARKTRFHEITPADALASADLWSAILNGDISLIPEDADLPRALALSIELDHPLEDCVYLALAERLDAPLVTADERFVARAHRRYPRVGLLARAR